MEMDNGNIDTDGDDMIEIMRIDVGNGNCMGTMNPCTMFLDDEGCWK